MFKKVFFKAVGICCIAIFAFAGQALARQHDWDDGVEGRGGQRGIVGPLGAEEKAGIIVDDGLVASEEERGIVGPLGTEGKAGHFDWSGFTGGEDVPNAFPR